MKKTDRRTPFGFTLLAATIALGASACAAPVDEAIDGEVGSAEQAASSSQCLNYQRGVVGTVADASIWESSPVYNTGAATFLYTGTSSAGFKQSLLYFDISNVPAGAHIDSATLSLYESWKAKGSTVSVHEILAPWDESTVTWASFDGSFDPVASTSFWAWGGGGHLAFHVEALVQGWVNGDSDNHGLLLQEPPDDNRTEFHSSEHAIVNDRPKLRICYTVTTP